MLKQIYVIAILLLSVCCRELVITKKYTDYLKRHVSWSVLDYNSNPFRGWTTDEVRSMLLQPQPTDVTEVTQSSIPHGSLPKIDWSHSACQFAPRFWASCGWPYSTVSMVSERCCLSGTDFGMLSVQEVISCDKQSAGCEGGWPAWALDYLLTVRGLVSDQCFPWRRMNTNCPTKCENREIWSDAHVCNCMGGQREVRSVPEMVSALQSGPIVATFGICRSFMAYQGGVYHCNCEGAYLGVLPTEIVGFDDDPECHFRGKGAWGTLWGERGYFSIGCEDCGINGRYPKGNVYCPTVVRTVPPTNEYNNGGA